MVVTVGEIGWFLVLFVQIDGVFVEPGDIVVLVCIYVEVMIIEEVLLGVGIFSVR